MPIGPYEDWAACVTAQQNKGHDKKSAERICGELEQKAKESAIAKTKTWIKTFLRGNEDNE